VIDLRILALRLRFPSAAQGPLLVIMWAGLGLSVTTGILLLLAYPTKELTNPDFYAKLTFITLGVITMRKVDIRVFGDSSLGELGDDRKRGRYWRGGSLFFWIGVVTLGRLLPDTAIYGTFGHPAGG